LNRAAVGERPPQNPMIDKYNRICDPDDWDDEFSHEFMYMWFHCHRIVTAFWRGVETRPIKYGNRLTSNTILSEVDFIMANKLRKQNGAKSGNASGTNSTPSKRNIRWLNIYFEDEDVAQLEQSTATLEYLSARLLALVSTNVSTSSRVQDDGKSYCVTIIYTPDDGVEGDSLGFSGFGDNIRDAALGAIYKHDIKLDANLPAASQLYADQKQSKRFR